MKVGDKVRYIPFDGAAPSQWEKGIIKAISYDGSPWVVYHCGEDWNNYTQYTGARTPIDKLRIGW